MKQPMERIELETPRLRLRAWRDNDLDALAEMSADPLVMRFFPDLLSRDDCAAALARWRIHYIRYGFTFWALERRDDGRFIGITGLAWSRLTLPFCPAVEIGWRLVPDQWGQGLAQEAAQAALACGFERLAMPEVIAYTAAVNERSLRLMAALGMQPGEKFEHPSLPEGHPLRTHRLFRLGCADWVPVAP